MTSELKKAYDDQGYVVVDGLIPESQFPVLEAACDRTVKKTRTGEWPHRRIVGKQFPPWNEGDPDSWGVQHVMNPELGEPVFAQWYTSDALVNVVKKLLICEEDELQMELFNLLINPTGHDFSLSWHRDDIKPTATAEEEVKALDVWHHGVQWNTALYTDSALFVVPGSHKLPRTAEQRKLSCDNMPPKDPMEMPGVLRVTIQPGQTVFYNSNILHCASYSPSSKRATLHGCMGSIKGGSTRSRNILQHGLLWMKDEKFKETLDSRGKSMLGRLIELQEGACGDAGFSLDG